METKQLEFLTTGWRIMTCKAANLIDLDVKELQDLLKESHAFLHELSREDSIPKAATALLWEMQEFSWWLSTLEATPMHYLYQPVIDAVNAIKEDFLTGNTDPKTVETVMIKN